MGPKAPRLQRLAFTKHPSLANSVQAPPNSKHERPGATRIGGEAA